MKRKTGPQHPAPGRVPQHAIQRQAALLPEFLTSAAAAVFSGLPADRWLQQQMRAHREFGARDRRLLADTVFAYFRWKGWIDAVKADPVLACILAHMLDAVELPPAVTALASRRGIPLERCRPVGHLPLEERGVALAALTGLPAPPLDRLLPSWLYSELKSPAGLDPEQFRRRLLEALQASPPTWLRVTQAHVDEVRVAMAQAGFGYQTHSRIPTAVALPRGTALSRLPAKVRRYVEIQDLASQAVGLACAPAPKSSWWDVCAGAGGKSLHLADLMGSTGSILATDVRPWPLAEIERRARKAGVRTIRTELWDGLHLPPAARSFDGVLVDAPCSGIGTWHRNPDARWRTLPREIADYAAQQRELLLRVADSVQIGGVLVYATCTLTARENDHVITRFLAARSSFALAPFVNPLTGELTDGTLWVHPWDAPCNGMFIARLQRQT